MSSIKVGKPLEVIIEGLQVDEIIKEDFKKKMKESFPEYKVSVIGIDIILPSKPKEPSPAEDIGSILTIRAGFMDTLKISHRSSEDVRLKKAVVSSSNENLTERFLKVLEEVARK